MEYLQQGIIIQFKRVWTFLTKNMSKIVGKNISKCLSGKYHQKLVDHPKQSATDALKTASKRKLQKTA